MNTETEVLFQGINRLKLEQTNKQTKVRTNLRKLKDSWIQSNT